VIVEHVRQLVWSIPVRTNARTIPFTLAYVLLDASGRAIVVDPGWESEVGWEDLCVGLEVAGVPLNKVTGIVLTHCHLDHGGLAARLAAASGAWIGAHPVEIAAISSAHDVPEAEELEQTWLRHCGVPEAEVEMLCSSSVHRRAQTRIARPSLALPDDSFIPLEGRKVRVIWTPGHTAGHVCLVDVDSSLLLTGDHVLPTIAPNIGSYAVDRVDTVGAYLASLERLREWDSFEAAPGHEFRFQTLPDRINQLEGRHRRRWANILEVLDGRSSFTVFEMACRMRWSRGWENLDGTHQRLALGETRAHLVHLAARGLITVRSDDLGRLQVSSRG
jgi:glyoxylase-like metal-dependent hydrolase (beta-lactamase superfamily II)